MVLWESVDYHWGDWGMSVVLLLRMVVKHIDLVSIGITS